MTGHPPKLRDRNKHVLFEIAFPPGAAPAGVISYSRWKAAAPPLHLPSSSGLQFESRESVYDYPSVIDPSCVEWHVNFADPNLFVAYGSGLFAQDEMQVAEHPILACVREALPTLGESARTEEDGAPTPILIRGAERRLAVATNPDAGAGRPLGLYGNRFAAADEETIRRATRLIDPPTVTNLIAMAAPAGGSGDYSGEEIARIITTAYTAFAAARIESHEGAGDGAMTVVHTGFWGCGAFGGNRALMSILQLLAARFAEIDVMVFHTVSRAGSEILNRAMSIHDREFGPARGRQTTDEVLDRLEGLALQWGVSDGN